MEKSKPSVISENMGSELVSHCRNGANLYEEKVQHLHKVIPGAGSFQGVHLMIMNPCVCHGIILSALMKYGYYKKQSETVGLTGLSDYPGGIVAVWSQQYHSRRRFCTCDQESRNATMRPKYGGVLEKPHVALFTRAACTIPPLAASARKSPGSPRRSDCG